MCSIKFNFEETRNVSISEIAKNIVKVANEDWFFTSVEFNDITKLLTFKVKGLIVNATIDKLGDDWFRVRFEKNVVAFVSNKYDKIFHFIEFVKDIFVKEFDKIIDELRKPKKKGNVKVIPFNTLW